MDHDHSGQQGRCVFHSDWVMRCHVSTELLAATGDVDARCVAHVIGTWLERQAQQSDVSALQIAQRSPYLLHETDTLSIIDLKGHLEHPRAVTASTRYRIESPQVFG